LKGSTAVNFSRVILRIVIPLRNANGNQIKEHTRCQKLFFVLNFETYASKRSQRLSLGASIPSSLSGAGSGVSVGG
jgi:hypothetical protein